MRTVQSLLRDKRRIVYSSSPQTTAREAMRIMTENDIGAVMVQEKGNVVGILSERDILRKVVFQNRSLDTTPLRDIMTTKVFSVRPDQTVEECMALMIENHIRHLPVLEQGHLVDVISIRDVVRVALEEKIFIIKQLEQYIRG